MLTFAKIAKEIADKHAMFYGEYRHQIPSFVLSFSASEYLKAISKVRSSEDAYRNFKRISMIDALYGDFVDPSGADEMSRTIAKVIKQ